MHHCIDAFIIVKLFSDVGHEDEVVVNHNSGDQQSEPNGLKEV